MNQGDKRKFLIKCLVNEQEQYRGLEIPASEKEQKQLLRGLMNIRSPKKISQQFLAVQDEYLQSELLSRGIVELKDLPQISDGIYLWQGDITRLACDAIVNAANSGMTGCYVPNHRCIDNCIHTYSGVQLRLECKDIMRKQGYEEPTGKAKITPAFNLPSAYVIHTVGPIVQGLLMQQHCSQLESCYHSCLELAEQHELDNLAFCCISTGEFHFPNEKAAEIAVKTVKDFMKRNVYVKKVIFNVFNDMDKEIYERLLGTNP